MSEPWLEKLECVRKGPFSKTGPVLVDGAGYPVADVRDDDGLGEMLSAAPDMCRALLAVEWAAVEWAGTCNSHEVMCYEPHAICPKCGGADPHESFVHPDEAGHHHDCTFDAALTKCGLSDQASRDAARKELGI
jgi:hypothetical protein